ncbi:MAG: ABC transporter ATP-binding protein [Thermodesulfovibrionales bacterium]|nr:ABC transporter ATP-binding protein [Thermodesulfovibrionales bacterium]
MLEVRGLSVRVGQRTLFSEVDLDVRLGETVALFGPNGSGKTSLLKTILGLPGFQVVSGSILFKGREITALAAHERAALGMGLAFQHPVTVRGVRLGDLLDTIIEKHGTGASAKDIARLAGLEDFLDRDLNLGFSGGEAKRSELLQLLAQDPCFVMFDEPDSGVDLGSISLVGEIINTLLQKDMRRAERRKAGMIITHAGHILDHVNADRAYVMMDGGILCSGNPLDLLEDIRTRGYKGCMQCAR